MEKEAQAQVTVEGIIAVEEVSTTTPVGEKPALPESVRTYHSNGIHSFRLMKQLSFFCNK